MMMAPSFSLLSDDVRERIRVNYLRCERQARLRPIFAGGFLLAASVAGGALVVDYMIVSEFWTRALADEFLELPGTLATSVAFKSLQVLFATIAAHILFEHMGRFGRALFVRGVFVLALLMLVGVGLLLALMSLPNGLSAVSGGTGSSLGAALSQLGVETGGTREAAVAAEGLASARTYQPVLWMASLGVIFLVVTGVAALCLHYALENVRRLVATREFKNRARDFATLRALETDYAETRAALAELEGPENRRHLLWTALMAECRAYERGLDEARRGINGSGMLALPSPEKSGRRRWGRKARQAAADQAQGDRFRRCQDAQKISRYEQLFDDWWERRSRIAMGAGPVSAAGIREPISHILPPADAASNVRRFPALKAAE